jgi:anti-sigma-K factor RskA
MRLGKEAKHALAAEYVVGTLRGPARRRLEALAREDRELAEALSQWQAQLTPLADRVPAVEPPARVWSAIERRIGENRGQTTISADPNGNSGLSPILLWRAIGMLASGLAAVLAVAFLWFSPARDTDPAFVAVLTASDSVPRMVVAMHPGGEMRVRVVKPWAAAEGKSLELWALPKNGAPRSLGLIANERDTRLRLAQSDPRLVAASALAVSLEPRGGSPTGQPTGPVLCSGVIAPFVQDGRGKA